MQRSESASWVPWARSWELGIQHEWMLDRMKIGGVG